MVFKADTAFAVELIALVAGTALLLASAKADACCKAFAKGVAIFTIVATILTMLCTGYYSIRYWSEGHFQAPYSRMGHMKGKHKGHDHKKKKKHHEKKEEKKAKSEASEAKDSE